MLRSTESKYGVVGLTLLLSVVTWCLGTAGVRAEDAKVGLVALGDSSTRGVGRAWWPRRPSPL
jgi:hypothetical protein